MKRHLIDVSIIFQILSFYEDEPNEYHGDSDMEYGIYDHTEEASSCSAISTDVC